MSTPEANREARVKAIQSAQEAAHRTAFELARDAGAPIISRQEYHGSRFNVQDVEPLAGLKAAREVELGARFNAGSYIREARQAGHAWQEIGEALSLTPIGEEDTIAEAAYTYAAGRPDSEHARRYGRYVTWRCASCDGLVRDRGPFMGPVDNEPGHTEDCTRLAAESAPWDAHWDTEWEAGR
jgi:hypothetical protein